MKAINIDGTIKTFPKGIPKSWEDAEGRDILSYHRYSPERHYADGFRDPITPPYDPATQRLGELYEDADGDILYKIIDKTPEEIEQEKVREKFQKQRAEKEKIYKAKVDKYVEENLTLEESLVYYEEWEPRAYALNEKAVYKGKTFINDVEGNTNAPDKGGWTEKK